MYSRAEECLQAVVLPDLERGRAGWDRPHTELVVKYVKEIAAASRGELELDEDMLVVAAYGHDWGYADLFEKGQPTSIADIKDRKHEHMRRGANMMSRLLHSRREFNYLDDDRKFAICRLIFVHDRLDELRDPHELILMEADTLASFDGLGTKSGFSEASKAEWREKAMERRVPRFITDYSRAKLAELLEAEQDVAEEGLGGATGTPEDIADTLAEVADEDPADAADPVG